MTGGGTGRCVCRVIGASVTGSSVTVGSSVGVSSCDVVSVEGTSPDVGVACVVGHRSTAATTASAAAMPPTVTRIAGLRRGASSSS